MFCGAGKAKVRISFLGRIKVKWRETRGTSVLIGAKTSSQTTEQI
jgi:hypothetical protein